MVEPISRVDPLDRPDQGSQNLSRGTTDNWLSPEVGAIMAVKPGGGKTLMRLCSRGVSSLAGVFVRSDARPAAPPGGRCSVQTGDGPMAAVRIQRDALPPLQFDGAVPLPACRSHQVSSVGASIMAVGGACWWAGRVGGRGQLVGLSFCLLQGGEGAGGGGGGVRNNEPTAAAHCA